MRSLPPDTTGRVLIRNSRQDLSGPRPSSDQNPSAPSEVLMRLAMVLLVALGFGLTAQLLVGAPL